jgi:hypothetical protein
MSDEVDRADQEIERSLAESIRNARMGQDYFQAGAPGECELCGEWSGRLVNGACAPCRDKYKLP